MIAASLALAVATAPAVLPQLAPLSRFVGHCWEGEAPGGAAGIDRHCFTAIYGGHHIRDTHEVSVKGKVVYAGETLYSAEGDTIAFTYWNSLGGVGHGTAASAGDTLTFSGAMREEPSSVPAPMHATWRVTRDGYQVIWPDGTPHLMRRVK
jgi:hypothetical protein